MDNIGVNISIHQCNVVSLQIANLTLELLGTNYASGPKHLTEEKLNVCELSYGVQKRWYYLKKSVL